MPYRPVTSAGGLAIYRLKRLKVILEDQADMNDEASQALGQTFMDGFEAYPEGLDVWKRHQDESI